MVSRRLFHRLKKLRYRKTRWTRTQGALRIDTTTTWFLIVGALLILMGLLDSMLRRLPLSPAMFYLPIGFALGPAGVGLIKINLSHHAELLTLVTQIALLISLFSVGLTLRVPLRDKIWMLPVRLGVIAMIVTIALLALVGIYLLHLPPGAAILMAAILAPTDPILASDVQVQDVGDKDRIRFSLSGEGGLNDGTAFPFVMLGLGLLAVPQAHDYVADWAVLRVLWAILAGLGCGWLMGWAVGRLVVFLRRDYQLALGMEEFLTLGLIALSYGLASAVEGVGFIAVFAAGVAIRRIEHVTSGTQRPSAVIGPVAVGEEDLIATDPDKAQAYMTEAVLGFNQQLEHIAEFAMVLLLGAILSSIGFSVEGVYVAALLFLVIRPVSVTLALFGVKVSSLQRRLMAWFGIRGIGSLYYLMFALQFSWPSTLATRIASLVLTVVAISIVVHGISSTPLMEMYHRRRK